jgi:sugar/nucleoside kinase (ribokinase family)
MTMNNATYDIITLGAAAVDTIIHVSEEYLATIPGKRGGQEPIDEKMFHKLLDDNGENLHYVTGGSATNVIRGLSRIGHQCAIIGISGDDDAATHYATTLKECSIHSYLIRKRSPSTQVVCLVTPDGERTMRTYIAASALLTAEDIPEEPFSRCRFFHAEGYALYTYEALEQAYIYAKKNGVTTSLDLASFEIVRDNKERILHLLTDYIDLVFANADEALMLTGCDDEESAAEKIAKDTNTQTVVLMGTRGCWHCSEKEKVHYPAYPVTPVDTTGAGDLFACGFIHGILKNLTAEESAHCGALLGNVVVGINGADIPYQAWAKLKESEPLLMRS